MLIALIAYGDMKMIIWNKKMYSTFKYKKKPEVISFWLGYKLIKS